MVQRLTHRKRHSYATKSNQTRVVKTQGGLAVCPKCSKDKSHIDGSPI